MYKNFPKLRALDGYRKTVEMENMRDVLPKEQEETITYSVEHVQWFDEAELLKKNPEKSRIKEVVENIKNLDIGIDAPVAPGPVGMLAKKTDASGYKKFHCAAPVIFSSRPK